MWKKYLFHIVEIHQTFVDKIIFEINVEGKYQIWLFCFVKRTFIKFMRTGKRNIHTRLKVV